LAFLYGSILTDGGDGSAKPTSNICVFAEAEVDRSPTGSGVTARLAAMHAKGVIAIGETRRFESIVGSVFTGAVERTTSAGGPCYPGRAGYRAEGGGAPGRGSLVR